MAHSPAIAMTTLSPTASLPAGIPVVPDGDEARQWAADELAKSVYQEAKPSLIDQLLTSFIDWVVSLFEGIQGVNANFGIVLIAVAAAVLIGLAIWLVKPRLNPADKVGDEVFSAGDVLTSAQHRAAARTAAGRGSYGDAVAEQFRAIVRSAEERAVIDPQPGRTAEEVSSRLRRPFPQLDVQLHDAGSTFNGVRYGNSPADRTDFDRLAVLDEQLLEARPVYGPAATELVSPR